MAIRLAAINYSLGLIVLVFTYEYFSKLQSSGSMIVSQCLSLALLVWLYYKIYVGRNWARITLLAFSVLGGLMTMSSVFMGVVIAAPAVAKVQMSVGLAINLAVLWLLFISPGRHWFRRSSGEAVA
ncbi:MAG: hypothetical protein H7Y89_20300 [Steroidobacteraceae bacterium]|nr:hypothetical protein [Steroidobacteraceae bacterium]